MNCSYSVTASRKASYRSRILVLASPPDDLTATIRALDAEVFDAYTKCHLPKFAASFADDLEFYHDQGGLNRRASGDG